jgi:ethanolamine ammonia-lyase small subunit
LPQGKPDVASLESKKRIIAQAFERTLQRRTRDTLPASVCARRGGARPGIRIGLRLDAAPQINLDRVSSAVHDVHGIASFDRSWIPAQAYVVVRPG